MLPPAITQMDSRGEGKMASGFKLLRAWRGVVRLQRRNPPENEARPCLIQAEAVRDISKVLQPRGERSVRPPLQVLSTKESRISHSVGLVC